MKMLLMVFVGGGLGSIARFAVGRMAIFVYPNANFPMATLVSNVLSMLLLAFFVSQSARFNFSWIQPLIMVGFCGGFSTFSGFGLETYELLRQNHWVLALLNVLISVGAGLIIMYIIINTNKNAL